MGTNSSRPIGVFDSGVGGLSVLRCMREELPCENFLYVADSGFAPYGDKPAQYIEARAFAVTSFLKAQDAKAIVLACNTATAVAVAKLRSAFDIPIIGMEPGVKPAIAASQCKIVGIMATTETLKSEKFSLLVKRFGSECAIITQPCPGLAEQVERFDIRSKKTLHLLEKYVGAIVDKGVDIIVLGCTHYLFLARIIQEIAGEGVKVIDTGVAVAREVRRRLEAAGILSDQSNTGVESFWSSGEINSVQKIINQLWSSDALVKTLP